MQYAKGDYQTFRAITKIHLGALSDNLHEGEEVDFDGYTMRRGGVDHPLHSLRGAIKAGWLISHGSPETEYKPQPAGVVVHRADGVNDGVVDLGIAVDREDVSVGSLRDVRPTNAPDTHMAANAGIRNRIADASSEEGKVVARFKTSAKQGAVQIGKDDRKVVKTLDNKSSVDVEHVTAATGVATGDVQEAHSGVSLEDLLPTAASTGTPDPGVLKDGVRVTEKAGNLDITTIQQFIPGFEWDTSVQWRRRAKIAVDKYGNIPAVIKYILSVETDSVKAHIEKSLNAQ